MLSSLPRPATPAPTRLRRLLVAALLAFASFAAAQQCTYEVEPNDTPAEATFITGAGPDAVMDTREASTATLCLTGEIDGRDQDAFWWEVDEIGAAHQWTARIEGVPRALTRFFLYRVEFAEDGVGVTRADELFTFASGDGSMTESKPFLIEPGRYVIGLAVAGGSGQYVVQLVPQLLSRRSNKLSDRNAHGEFNVVGPVAGQSEQRFTIPEGDAGFAWRLELEAALGSTLHLELEGPDGQIGSRERAAATPARMDGYALQPGSYVARITGESATARLVLSKLGRLGEGQEVEPNNSRESATLFPLGTEMRGTTSDPDWFRTVVGGEDAERAWDLVVEASGEIDVGVFDESNRELFRRRYVSGVVEGLHLTEGSYTISINYVRPGPEYRLAWQPAAARPANHNEVEPNDSLATATELADQAEARGFLGDQDGDYFRFHVAGEAQLYRVQVVGQGVTRLSVYSGGGTLIAEERGQGRLRLDDLLLLPGAQHFAVHGEGEYAVRAMSLGPAPVAEHPAGMPGTHTELSAAPAGPAEPAANEPVTGPPSVEPPPVVQPPPGHLEYEPNDSRSRAHRLRAGEVHVGRLGTPTDEDYYRFYLAEDQFVRLELVPPEGSQGLMFDLEGVGRFQALAGEAGNAVVMERWLLAGDYSLYVHARSAATRPSGYYQLRLRPLAMLDLPVDLEPNDNAATASTMPAELSWEGRVGEVGDSDYYAFPVFAVDTTATVRIESDPGINVYLRGDSGRERTSSDEQGGHLMELSAGEARYLELAGRGRYRVEVAFSDPPDAAQLLPPRGDGAISLELFAPTHELAAFWHEGQRVEAGVLVSNSSDEHQEVRLRAAANEARAVVTLPESVRLEPGESKEVPLYLDVAADTRDDTALYLEVLASSAAGTASSRSDLDLACSHLPVSPFPYHNLPRGLLGKPDVLWSAFGAAIHGEASNVGRLLALIDGRTTISYGGYGTSEQPPTFVLAGEAPVTLLATSLHPQAGQNRSAQLRRFRVETSMDGVTFTPAFEGELKAAHIEQVFEFGAPVRARYARLVPLDNIGGSAGQGYVGEWKLYAEEAALLSGLDLAEPSLGGHVVWSGPRLSTNPLNADERARHLDVRRYEGYTFVVGFHHGRAALIDRMTWRDSEEALAAPSALAEMVMVEVSLSGAAGPWEPVTEWRLERDRTGEASMALDEPVWARYVRFTVPKGEATQLYEPLKVSIMEADVGAGDYLSALAEWGHMTREAVYELLVADPEAPAQLSSSQNHGRDTAFTLTPGQPVGGTVAIGANQAWFKIAVGQEQNLVEVRLSGDPTIGYRYELTDAEGRRVMYEVRDEGDAQVLTFFAEPGDYYLMLEEPKRSVIFAWDTSGSVAPYVPITYGSLAEFARLVDGEREAVQLLAYNSPTPDWLLPLWSSDPLRVQRAIQEYDRRADSSNTELALLTATLGLADREGTKAVLLITDAESDGAGLTPQLWRALEEVRPRVFTFEVSSGGSDYAQDMMQDYAAVNGGYYDMADGVGDFDAGFARANCMLRRPKRYEVEVTVDYVPPPGPGVLNVVAAPGVAGAAVEVIFDASGSMGQLLPSGEQRIAAAKRALEALVGEVLPDETPFALRAFGHIAPTSCETRLDLPFAPLDRAKAMAAVRAIEPKLLSGTPIAASLAAVAADLGGARGARQVILITDGEESCGGDPAAAVRELRGSGPLSLAIVSLALEPEALAVFQALAEEVGASFVDVGSYEALNQAITEALNPAFEVYDQDGALVAEGRVGGAGVELPMGVYRVRVLSAPVELFDDVRVPGDGQVTVNTGR